MNSLVISNHYKWLKSTCLFLARFAAAVAPEIAWQHCDKNTDADIIGLAFNSTGDFLYCEQVQQKSLSEMHIDYRFNKNIFATKDLNTQQSPVTPDFFQEDFRSGEIRQSKAEGAKLLLSYQENKKSMAESVSLDKQTIDVIDAGFDYWIRNHWQELHTEESKSLKFGSAAHLKEIDLRIRLQPLESCGAKAISEVSDTRFIVDIDNFFLRAFLGKMHLIYNEQKKLKYFSGPVNINDQAGKTQIANIRYFYLTDVDTSK